MQAAAWEARMTVDPTPRMAYSVATDEFLHNRRFMRRAPAPVRAAGWLLRGVIRLDEPQVLAEEEEELQVGRRPTSSSSKWSVAVGLLWNLSSVVVGITMLGLSTEEKPPVPLRFWVSGYVLLSVVHIGCVITEINRGENEDSDDETDDYTREIAKTVKSANNMASVTWWIIGFYFFVGGDALCDAPRLFWLSLIRIKLCVAFLLCDIMFIIVCLAATGLYCLSVCCCLPCLIAILPALSNKVETTMRIVCKLYGVERVKQDGATDEEINSLPKFKFRRVGDSKRVDEVVDESCERFMTEDDTSAVNDHVDSQDYHECGICLEIYGNREELRQLPCQHRFHCVCIDKWLRRRSTCPMCKFDFLKLIYGTDIEG